MARPTKGQIAGQYIASKMANHVPLTKQQMLRKWKSLRSIRNIEHGINWIEANTSLSNNPFLFVWDNRSPVWGFKHSFGEIKPNVAWNLGYIQTRMMNTETVINHMLASPVVTMTPTERRLLKSIAAQAGGTVAFIQSMVKAL